LNFRLGRALPRCRSCWMPYSAPIPEVARPGTIRLCDRPSRLTSRIDSTPKTTKAASGFPGRPCKTRKRLENPSRGVPPGSGTGDRCNSSSRDRWFRDWRRPRASRGRDTTRLGAPSQSLGPANGRTKAAPLSAAWLRSWFAGLGKTWILGLVCWTAQTDRSFMSSRRAGDGQEQKGDFFLESIALVSLSLSLSQIFERPRTTVSRRAAGSLRTSCCHPRQRAELGSLFPRSRAPPPPSASTRAARRAAGLPARGGRRTASSRLHSRSSTSMRPDRSLHPPNRSLRRRNTNVLAANTTLYPANTTFYPANTPLTSLNTTSRTFSSPLYSPSSTSSPGEATVHRANTRVHSKSSRLHSRSSTVTDLSPTLRSAEARFCCAEASSMRPGASSILLAPTCMRRSTISCARGKSEPRP
jgi:hypothetical protein